MTSIERLFAKLRDDRRKAVMPFVTAGDPDLDFTAQVIGRLDAVGAHLCEVGFPYSDPIADGPVIQASYTRALRHRLHVDQIFEMLKTVSGDVTMPLVTMVSFAIVHRYGAAKFVKAARNAGASGAIVPDLPVEEAADLASICRDCDFNLIQLVTPTTQPERSIRIAQCSSGFIYYVSVAGITGERTKLPDKLVDNVAWLRQQTDLPVCVGFGIGSAEQAKLVASVADGIIVGSAFVRRVAEAASRPRDAVLDDVARFTTELLDAVGDSRPLEPRGA